MGKIAIDPVPILEKLGIDDFTVVRERVHVGKDALPLIAGFFDRPYCGATAFQEGGLWWTSEPAPNDLKGREKDNVCVA